MLEVARRDGARFLLTSTSECYGDPLEHPQVETYWGNVNPVGMRSCYDESKRYAEAMTMAYHRVYGVRTNIARIFNTYGPAHGSGRRPRGAGVSRSGAARRAADHIRRRFPDAQFLLRVGYGGGLVRLSRSEERYPVNLGNPGGADDSRVRGEHPAADGIGLPRSFIEPLPSDDPRKRRPDISKAQRMLGWEPKVTLEDGLRETVEYFKALSGATAEP